MIGLSGRRRRPRRWRRWVLLSAALLLIGLIIWFIMMMRRPAVSIVNVVSSPLAAESIHQVQLVGTLFTFSYPSDWKLNWHELASPPRYLEKAQTTVAEPHPYRFVISVETSVGPLAEVPSVQARRRDLNGQYDETTRQVSGQTAVEYIRRDKEFERTLFWIQAGRLYTVSLTSPVAVDGDAIFNQYVSSIILP